MGTVASPQIGSSLNARITASAGSANTNTTVDHANATSPTVGSGTGNVQKVYHAPFVVADSSTPTNIDLSAATDPQGTAITLSAVRALKLSNSSTVAAQVMTLSTVTNGLLATSQGPINPSGSLTLDAGGVADITVDGTHKVISITVASGTNVAGLLTVFGR